MKKKVKFFLFAAVFLMSLTFISAGPINNSLHLNIQTLSSGAVTTGTFVFGFNISTSNDCTVAEDVVYTNYSTLTTDSRGIISHYLEDVNLNFSDQYWLCYYRDGVLIDTSKISRTAYSFRAQNTTLSGVEVDSDFNLGGYNLTTLGGWGSGGVSILATDIYIGGTTITGSLNTSADVNLSSTLYVDSTNKMIGIGTINPTEKLMVNGSLRVQNSTGELALYVNESTGFVGVGTAAPNYSLQIDKDKYVKEPLLFLKQYQDVGNPFMITLDNSHNRDVGIAFMNQGVYKWIIGNNGPEGNVFTIANGTALEDSSGEIFTIHQGGYVGIGIDPDAGTPDQMLEVFNGNIKIGDDTDTNRGIVLERNSADVGTLNTANNRLNLKAYNNNKIYIIDDSENGMIIDDGGNVGIGEANPDSRLEVNGALHVTALEGTYTNNEAYICVYNNGTIFSKDSACL